MPWTRGEGGVTLSCVEQKRFLRGLFLQAMVLEHVVCSMADEYMQQRMGAVRPAMLRDCCGIVQTRDTTGLSLQLRVLHWA